MGKHKKQQQKKIAEETIEQAQRRVLQQQIRFLKRVPKDFRDIDVGSPDWEQFADITGRRLEMVRWANGPVVYTGRELNEYERRILGSPNKLVRMYCDWYVLDKVDWQEFIAFATNIGASWLYLPEEELSVIAAFNVLFSRFGLNIRAKGQLLSERTGHPIGVVH